MLDFCSSHGWLWPTWNKNYSVREFRRRCQVWEARTTIRRLFLEVISKALLKIHQSNKQRDEKNKFLLSKHDATSSSHLDFQSKVFSGDKKFKQLATMESWINRWNNYFGLYGVLEEKRISSVLIFYKAS
ncbi:hypothetical protein O6H91_04G128200 [Diphasiastrum complanatum]|uniref:Uncharacterized protein n=1 Tax=Diphasiastrum complanatum TaxID=34168 RepID=A0ACC2E1T5_DIPCM|nr:hypothetical protein O6H91_04G128200 [Diphasiastrum complanatum]